MKEIIEAAERVRELLSNRIQTVTDPMAAALLHKARMKYEAALGFVSEADRVDSAATTRAAEDNAAQEAEINRRARSMAKAMVKDAKNKAALETPPRTESKN